jgi:sigma-B regulation protein RsbU (phosphoserine phosphatase)
VSRILVVEDDPAVLRGLKDNLIFESYDVLTASDAERAYRLIYDERPDLVLMDVMLPGMWGSELCRRVRAEGVTTPIVMLTAKAEESDRVLGLDLGADDYVSKPFAVRELCARIRAILRNRRDAIGDHGRLVRELQSAADVQRTLFPRVPSAQRSLDYAGVCRPASAVGGDYFDYVPIDDSRVAFVLADVAGKGMPAALLMASLHGVIRAQAASMAMRLEELVSTINTLLQQNASRPSYATLFYAVYDDRTRMLEYVNAGHPSALVVRTSRQPDRRVTALDATCPPVGLFATLDATPARIQLEAGDWLVVYSDGATEALNAAGDEFGPGCLIDLVIRLGRECAQGLCDGVVEALAQHQAGARQHDDITVLAVRVGVTAS